MDGTKNTGYDNSLDDVERGGGDDDEPDETPRTITEPTEIVCAEMKAYNERRMKSDQFYHEFMCLPTGSHGKHSYSSMKVNVSKNRFASILAFDHSRVKLHTDHQNESDYINANYIDASIQAYLSKYSNIFINEKN
ncbi:hypothetical protein SNE40_015177 [Patella caerulea]|uniref:Tyrosine-protein phosphatase domain-containing protein n=1 Tax=Patella caerulea TaxID=87958 RepID=A0AAN8PRQ3_PATCE